MRSEARSALSSLAAASVVAWMTAWASVSLAALTERSTSARNCSVRRLIAPKRRAFSIATEACRASVSSSSASRAVSRWLRPVQPTKRMPMRVPRKSSGTAVIDLWIRTSGCSWATVPAVVLVVERVDGRAARERLARERVAGQRDRPELPDADLHLGPVAGQRRGQQPRAGVVEQRDRGRVGVGQVARALADAVQDLVDLERRGGLGRGLDEQLKAGRALAATRRRGARSRSRSRPGGRRC